MLHSHTKPDRNTSEAFSVSWNGDSEASEQGVIRTKDVMDFRGSKDRDTVVRP